MPDPQFIARLEDIISKAGGRSALEEIAGLKKDSLRMYLRGSDPTRQVLMKLAKASGVSIDWLASGRGDDQPKPFAAASQRFDQECMRQIIEAVEESEISKPPDEKAELILSLYEMFCAAQAKPSRSAILRLIKTA